MSYDDMRSSVPEGVSGNWEVKKFIVSDEDARFSALRSVFSFSSRGRSVPAGQYTGLYVDGQVMMSDTPSELRGNFGPVSVASGICLVSGLGLGCVVEGMLKKRDSQGRLAVDKVIVLEKSKDVIKLVGLYLLDRYRDRLEIRNVDALEYKPPREERYDVVWHDIWLYLCEDNLEEMTKLHRRYGRKADWQGSWGREILKRRRQQNRRNDRRGFFF
jgi:hypothetical protein